MKIALQYLHDVAGNTQAVQIPITDWKKLLGKLQKYEQALKLQSDLQEAMNEVKSIKKLKAPKQTLNEFLNEL